MRALGLTQWHLVTVLPQGPRASDHDFAGCSQSQVEFQSGFLSIGLMYHPCMLTHLHACVAPLPYPRGCTPRDHTAHKRPPGAGQLATWPSGPRARAGDQVRPPRGARGPRWRLGRPHTSGSHDHAARAVALPFINPRMNTHTLWRRVSMQGCCVYRNDSDTD